MAAPSPTAKQFPFGNRLKDGHRTFVTFAAFPKWSVFPIEVTPLGADVGEKVNTTTMWNNDVVTYASPQLIDFTDGGFTGAYDPKMLTQALASILNVEQVITYHYPNGDTECFYGFLKGWTKNALVRNTMPTASFMVVATNVDPINDTEEVPVITLLGGT